MNTETDQQAPKIEDLTFKQASDELERVIRTLESDQLELEESLTVYQRGVELLKALGSRLEEAEQRVQVLMGEITPESTDDVDTTLS